MHHVCQESEQRDKNQNDAPFDHTERCDGPQQENWGGGDGEGESTPQAALGA